MKGRVRDGDGMEMRMLGQFKLDEMKWRERMKDNIPRKKGIESDRDSSIG